MIPNRKPVGWHFPEDDLGPPPPPGFAGFAHLTGKHYDVHGFELHGVVGQALPEMWVAWDEYLRRSLEIDKHRRGPWSQDGLLA